MVQDFSLRYPLIAGQGNFGSIDGDSAAAYRYTEAKLAPLATELLADIDKETVDFSPNFDDRLMEPVVLPSRVPNLLINGSSGIAVGMSTNIPPHNIAEVVQAAVHLLDHPDCSVADLMVFVPGPDFPTGGLIVGREGIRDAYETGRGRIIMQGRIGRESRRGGREQLVVTEIPYATNKSRIIEQIAELSRKGKAPDISDLRDESDRDGIRLVIELKRGADAKKVVRALLKWTALQSTFGVIALALDGGAPKEFSLKEMLERFRDHRIEVIVRRSRWERERALEEAHILEGLLIALRNIERVVAIIRGSRERAAAATRLREEFELTEIQADAILMMRLHRLTQLEVRELTERLAELQARIQELEALLASPELQIAEIRRELLDLSAKYSDPRRTRIIDGKPESMIDTMVAQEDVVVTISHEGFAKQIPMYLHRRRMTSGKALAEMERYGEDFIEHVFPVSTSDQLLFVTGGGQAHTVSVSDIPEAERSSRGRSLQQLFGLEKTDRVVSILSLARAPKEGALVFVTTSGTLKRTSLEAFSSGRAGGVNAINLREGDTLLDVHASDGTGDVVLVSRSGRAIRFAESEVPEMGRTAAGVRGIKLMDDDRVVGSMVLRREGTVCGVTDRAWALKIEREEIPAQRRDGKGTVCFRLDEKTGKLAGAVEVLPGEDLMLVTVGGSAFRASTDEVTTGIAGAPLTRATSLPGASRVVSVVRVVGEKSTRNPEDDGLLPGEVQVMDRHGMASELASGPSAESRSLENDSPEGGSGKDSSGADRFDEEVEAAMVAHVQAETAEPFSEQKVGFGTGVEAGINPAAGAAINTEIEAVDGTGIPAGLEMDSPASTTKAGGTGRGRKTSAPRDKGSPPAGDVVPGESPTVEDGQGELDL
jgi:DNA gyrase subunit A